MFPEKGRCIDTQNHDQQCSDWLAARQQCNDIISLKKTPDEKLQKILDLDSKRFLQLKSPSYVVLSHVVVLSLEKEILWIEDSYFSLKQWFEIKNIIMNLSSTQNFTSQDVNWWTGVVGITCGLLWCFYQLFGLSFWQHPFTAEDPSVCNVTQYLSSKSVPMTIN